MSLKELNSLINGRFLKGNLGRQMVAYTQVTRAQEILMTLLPPAAQDDIKVISLAKGELRVACRNPYAREELRYLSATFKELLAGEGIVADIVIQLRTDAWRTD